MTTPGAIRIKETAITWKHRVVVTAELPDRNLLRRFAVYVADEAGVAVSLMAQYSTAAAADHEHQKIVRQLTTGERNSA
jgi:hypothetical protein